MSKPPRGPAKGIVIDKLTLKAKGTQDTQRQCVRVQLIATGKVVIAFVPGDGNIDHIDENDEVFLMPTKKRDIPSVKYKVEKVASWSWDRIQNSHRRPLD
jgi:ribosomal protein S12